MASVIHEISANGLSCSDFDLDERLSYLPAKIKERLLPFQKKGIMFALERGGRCMIADEMGLGKTIQAIAVSYYYKNEWPLLIVVPSSLKYSWVEEMEKWIPDLCPEDIIIVQNKTDIWQIPRSKVIVLGYGLLTSDAQALIDTLCKQNFKVVIIDESHYMKSRNAVRSKILLPIVQNAVRAIFLTGTPALGRPEELFMQLEALYPQKFGTWMEYAKKYCNAHARFIGKRWIWNFRGASNLYELHELLSDVMIRRMKSEVLTQLPPKIRQQIPFDLPKSTTVELKASFEEWEKVMRGSSPDSRENGQVLSLISSMFKQTAMAKAGAVKDYIKMLLENETLKFLIFGHHLCMLQACTEAVIESKVCYIRIDGSVPSSERINLVNQFQNDPDTRVAILSLLAAGQGLTFTAASHVVFAELYWDPGHIIQAEDRAHRIGQSSSVNIHYLIANGTLDSLMWAMLNRKTKVTGTTLNGKKEKLKVQEGDREKWNFLSFAEAWIPDESLSEIEDEMLFTHFEKERQHDIRDFLSPKREAEKKRKNDSYNKSSCLSSNFSQASEEDELENGGIPDPGGSEELDIFCREVKRPRVLDPSTSKHVPNKKRKKALFRETNSSFAEDNQEDVYTPVSKASKGLTSEGVWHCSSCTYSNNPLLPYCEMCGSCRKNVIHKESQAASLSAQSEDGNAVQDTKCLSQCERIKEEASVTTNGKLDGCEQELQSVKLKDSESIQSYDGLMFCASRNTDRIHVYTKDGEPLNCNFIPLDIKLDNWEDLPECFQQKPNCTLILRFVREWSSLTAMKQRIIRKSSLIFSSPVHAVEEILSKQRAKLTSTKRYMTKEDIARASLTKAHSGGSVRIITKNPTEVTKACSSSAGEEDKSFSKLTSKDGNCPAIGFDSQLNDAVGLTSGRGYLQAVDNEGKPLCLSCQRPTIQFEQMLSYTAWDTRFCSLKCQEDFLFRTNQSYLRTKVFEIEHGICQLCRQNAHELYLCVRDAPRNQRKNLLEKSWMASLPLKQLNEIVLNPVEGHFWQADHIKPVFSGGGQCTLENIQTLCTVCHKERTAKQAKERSQVKKQLIASKYGSDITKFFVKL